MKPGKKILLAYILIFVTGLLIGGSVMHFFGEKRSFRPPKLSKIQQYVCRKMNCKLDLDEDQRQYLESVMAAHFAKIRQMHQQQEPQMIALINETHQKLELKLNPEQRRKLKAMRETIIERIKRRFQE